MNTENTINQIMWGAHFCSVFSGQGENVLLVIKPLSLKDKCFVDFIYKKALREAKDNNILTEFEFRNRLKVKQIWNETKDEYIEVTIELIKDLEKRLEACKKGDRSYKLTNNLIRSHKKSLMAQLRKKAELFYVTAEQYAEEVKSRAVVYCCTYNELEGKYWENWNAFESEVDLNLIGNIAIELNKLPTYDTKKIRKIARSPDWRYMWAAAKGNILALFGACVGEFDIDQRNLTYWSQVYDSVYEAYERPSEDTINNDDELDKWFEEQSRKNKKKELEQSGKTGKLKVSDKVRRHGEVFIVTNPNMNIDTPYRDAPNIPSNEEVENLNSSFVRLFKRKEQSRIKDGKMIREQDLRGRGNKIARQTIGSQDALIGKRNFGGSASGKSRVEPGGTF